MYCAMSFVCGGTRSRGGFQLHLSCVYNGMGPAAAAAAAAAFVCAREYLVGGEDLRVEGGAVVHDI